MITFPNAMKPVYRRRLRGDSPDDFKKRLRDTCNALSGELEGLRGYRPMVRVMQRRYPSQKSIPLIDGKLEFDLRAILGDDSPSFGPPIKSQQQWADAIYELLAHKQSNMQFQIGVQFEYPRFGELADKNADQYFTAAFRALRPFAAPVVDE